MNKSSNQFDNQFNLIDHYLRFPAMRPYVGTKYGTSGSKKIMLIGESNYLPEDSFVHKNAQEWYNSNQTNLTQTEVDWLHCRKLMECNWSSAGHMIFREIEKKLGVIYDNKESRAISNIVFMNGF